MRVPARLLAAALLGTVMLTACVEIRRLDGKPSGPLVQLRLGPESPEPDLPEALATESRPTPVDGARGVAVNADLAWTPVFSPGVKSVYDVLLATADGDQQLPCEEAPAPLCDPPGELRPDTLYRWTVGATTSDNQHWQGPVWTFTTAPSDGPLFFDDFSSDQGWIDQSGGQFKRDPDAAVLSWQFEGSGDRRLFLPIDVTAGDAHLSFRVNLVAGGGNQAVYFGLAEQLAGAWQRPDFPTGFFILIANVSENIPHLHEYISYANGAPEIANEIGACGDMTCANPETYLDLGSLDQWRRVDLTIRQRVWRIDLFDDGGTLLDSQAGRMTGAHDRYRYLMLVGSGAQLWEWSNGQLDDVVMERAAP